MTKYRKIYRVKDEELPFVERDLQRRYDEISREFEIASRGVVGYNIKLLRTERGISQRKLADELKCKLNDVVFMETGQAVPTLTCIRMLMRVFERPEHVFSYDCDEDDE